MKTIIAGSRVMPEFHVLWALSLCPFTPAITEVVSGGCGSGADFYGEIWAHTKGVPVRRFPADWDQQGKAAGPIRNRQMADYADALIAVWNGESRGTKDMIEQARRAGLEVFVWRADLRRVEDVAT